MRRSRSTLLTLTVDLLLVVLAWGIAFWLRFNLDVPEEFRALAVASAPLSVLAYGLGLTSARIPPCLELHRPARAEYTATR